MLWSTDIHLEALLLKIFPWQRSEFLSFLPKWLKSKSSHNGSLCWRRSVALPTKLRLRKRTNFPVTFWRKRKEWEHTKTCVTLSIISYSLGLRQVFLWGNERNKTHDYITFVTNAEQHSKWVDNVVMYLKRSEVQHPSFVHRLSLIADQSCCDYSYTNFRTPP